MKKKRSYVQNLEVLWRVFQDRHPSAISAGLGDVTSLKIIYLDTPRCATLVTIGIPGEHLEKIMNGRYVGGLVLCDREAFERKRQELEKKK